tara:strand:- start:347 stop:466 length:120 start_codon:yes stop_codon:yes gene_type:complete
MKDKVAQIAVGTYSLACVCMSIYFGIKNEKENILNFWIV